MHPKFQERLERNYAAHISEIEQLLGVATRKAEDVFQLVDKLHEETEHPLLAQLRVSRQSVTSVLQYAKRIMYRDPETALRIVNSVHKIFSNISVICDACSTSKTPG